MAQGDLTKLEGRLHTTATSARRRSRPGHYGRTEWPCGPDSFAVIEKWQDAAALAAHAAAPHMAAYGARVKDMLASRVVHVLAPAQR